MQTVMIGIKNHQFKKLFKTSNQNTATVKEIFNNVVHFLTSSLDERNVLEIKLKIHRKCLKQVNNKTGAGKDKINIKYCHHLFLIAEKNYIISLLIKKLPQSSESMEIKTLFSSFEK